MLSLPGTVVLWRRGGGDPGKRISLLVYGTCLVACYAASPLDHGVRFPADRLVVFIRLDSVGIFALIAGSYTPLAWNLMRGRWRVGTLATVWGTAAVCRACAEACVRRAAECGKHQAEHCKRCAEACRRCAEACRKMAA